MAIFSSEEATIFGGVSGLFHFCVYFWQFFWTFSAPFIESIQSFAVFIDCLKDSNTDL